MLSRIYPYTRSDTEGISNTQVCKMPILEFLLDLPPPQKMFYMSPITLLTSAREPDCEPGLVVDSINMENPPLIPGALLVRPAQHKPERI